MRRSSWIDAAFIRSHLSFFVFYWTKETSQDEWQDRKDHSHYKENHYRPVGCNWTANVCFCGGSYCLKKHVLTQKAPMTFMNGRIVSGASDSCQRSHQKPFKGHQAGSLIESNAVRTANKLLAVHINVTPQQD